MAKNSDKSEEIKDIIEEETKEVKEEVNELEELKKKYDELNDKHLRLMAEYDNFRKRTIKERSELYPQIIGETLEKFLPVIDNVNRAKQFDPATEEFAKGFTMICENFEDILKNFGVTEIGEPGEEFDPQLHNAVMHIEDDKLGKNVISQVFEKGYKIGSKVIRFATVQTAN